MKKKALVIFYSQMGQTQEAITALLQGLSKHVAVDQLKIESEDKFSFPWQMRAFFRVFPRCIRGLAPAVNLDTVDWHQYDLIILGYQVWFLSPSLPMQGFLNSPSAAQLRGKPVVTLATCRNLWISALNTVKARLANLGAEFVGQITLCERNPVWASFVTTPYWIFTGRKQGLRFLPPAGIAAEQFATLEPKGEQLGRLLASGADHRTMTEAGLFGANSQSVSLAMMEWIGIRFFRIWAGLIAALAPAAGLAQDILLLLFRLNLVVLILVVVPLTRIFQMLVGNDPRWVARFSRVAVGS
jgi:hypothetical protein